MKTISKLLALLLCMALILSACGASDTSSAASSESASVASSSTASSASSEVSASEALQPGDIVLGPAGHEVGGGWSDTVAEKKTDKDTFFMINGPDSGNLDPQQNGLIVGIQIEKHIFDTLIVKDDITGEFKPGLATDWEWVDDTHLKLTLREGVKFHNGEDFTSEDVLKTVSRFATGAATAALYDTFSYEDSSANGDYEVTIGFSAPCAPALNYLAHTRAAIVPADYLEENGEQALYQNPIGTGAYAFDYWNIGSDTQLVRNDDWWGKAEGYGDCYFKYIHITHTSELNVRAIALEAGELDLALNPEESSFTNIFEGNVPHLLASEVTGTQVCYVSFNWNYEPFNDIRVRQALAHAVDWDAAAEAAGGLSATVADSCLAPTIFAYAPQGIYEYDPELSKQLLEEAGYGDGMVINSFCQEGGVLMRMWEIVQAYWAEIGVTLNISQGDSATWVEAYTNGTCDMAPMNMTAMTLDPAHTLMQTTDDTNVVVGRMEDEKYNELCDAGLAAMDETERAEIYAELQKYVYDNVYQIPMYVPNITYAYWDYLEGVIPDAAQQLDVRVISLKTND